MPRKITKLHKSILTIMVVMLTLLFIDEKVYGNEPNPIENIEIYDISDSESKLFIDTFMDFNDQSLYDDIGSRKMYDRFHEETLVLLEEFDGLDGLQKVSAIKQLEKGDEGILVLTLQRDLSNLGYYDSSINGFFGSSTDEALQQFQEENEIEENGVAGPETYGVINELSTEQEGNTKVHVEVLTMEATAYTAYCDDCSGITFTGIDLRNSPNKKVVAVDPKVIPLGSIVEVEGYGQAIAGDTGGDIKGNRIDLHMPTKQDAYQFGRQDVQVTIIE